MKARKKNNIREAIVIAALFAGMLMLLPNYLLFHVLIEFFSVIILFVLFTVSWNARKIIDNKYLLVIGTSAFFIGTLDLLHTVTYTGMNIIQSDIFYANQFWIATRLFESIVLLIGFVFVSRKHRVRTSHLLLIYTIVTALITASILHWEIFPLCYIEGEGQTAFKIIAEYVVIAILLTALWVLYRNRRYFSTYTYRLIAASLILTVFSEFSFTLYFSNYGFFNQIGHILKATSFYLIYKANIESGFVNPTATLFLNLKKSEEALAQANKKLETEVATKDKFFSIIAHDLKNPFNNILGLSDLLNRKSKQYQPEKTQKLAEAIYISAENTYKLLENLLQWSRAQTGRIHYQPQQLDISDLATGAIILLKQIAQNKHIEIQNNVKRPTTAFADSDTTATVLRNLLSNALKFTPEHGKVTIDAYPEGNFLTITVTDTGVGMSDKKIDQLFKITKNISTEGTNREKGTGLGLILCKEFVEHNGGKIGVTSQQGQGSTFFFTLPLPK